MHKICDLKITVGLHREYWGGFFPILLVELNEGEDEVAAIEQRTVSLFSATYLHIRHHVTYFSPCLHIRHHFTYSSPSLYILHHLYHLTQLCITGLDSEIHLLLLPPIGSFCRQRKLHRSCNSGFSFNLM